MLEGFGGEPWFGSGEDELMDQSSSPDTRCAVYLMESVAGLALGYQICREKVPIVTTPVCELDHKLQINFW